MPAATAGQFSALAAVEETGMPTWLKGRHDQSATIRRWWLAQDYNIGIATGLISAFGFDVDGATGAADDLETQGNLPATLIGHQQGPHFQFRATGEFNQGTVVLAMVAMLGPKTVMSWRRLLFILTGLSIAGVKTPQ
jgi:hypothetical protein